MHGMAIIVIQGKERVNVKFLAKNLHASEAHLSKIFQRLNKAGFVKSQRGPAGGFELAKAPETVSMLDVYEAIEGKISLSFCPLGKEKCQFSKCIFGDKLNNISLAIYNTLKGINLSDFCENIQLKEM